MKKAMVVLAVLAMAVSSCDTGLQDKIDDLENKNKDLEQQVEQLNAQVVQLNSDKTAIEKKVNALKIALEADDDTAIVAAKTALKNAGYTEQEADGFLANIEDLQSELMAKTVEADNLDAFVKYWAWIDERDGSNRYVRKMQVVDDDTLHDISSSNIVQCMGWAGNHLNVHPHTFETLKEHVNEWAWADGAGFKIL